ncbi:MAG: IS5 family transposase [Oricola sp.]|nr:IS5 family transposase [Oricola sp.]MCI5076419.1 IS5 family transposase [Oricola sp.]
MGCAAGNACRDGADRRLATHGRQHIRPGSFAGSRRKRGTHKEGFGRSRGGFASKIHARSDGQGRPLGFVLTGGEASDYNAFTPLLEMPVRRPRLMLADKGYDGDTIREALLRRGILPVIPPKLNRRAPVKCDYRAHKDRNRIERRLNRLKQFRRIATRYDKTARSFLGVRCLAAARLWLPSFVNAA